MGAIPARPGPILLPSVPYRIGPGRAEADFLATSERKKRKKRENEMRKKAKMMKTKRSKFLGKALRAVP